jgi:hypothetical protein
MHLDVLRSKKELDLSADEVAFLPKSGFRGAKNCDDHIHAHFSLGNGQTARLTLTWADVESAIETFVEKGHPAARVLDSASKLASAICDRATISK